MDFLNSGSSKRAGHAPETTAVVDIYALLMHRKHFTPITATMDLILCRERGGGGEGEGGRDGRNVHTSCVSVRWIERIRRPVERGWWTPLCQRFFSAYPSLRTIPSNVASLATNRFGGLAEAQNVYINWPFNSREIDAPSANNTAKCICQSIYIDNFDSALIIFCNR